jgi:hypothetical protein
MLPLHDGTLSDYRLSDPPDFVTLDPNKAAAAPRVFYSAAHVVAQPLTDNDPWLDGAIDWDATLKFRNYLYSLGLGVAEAMDTAQRGMGLVWPGALELSRQSLSNAIDVGQNALIACGAGTDHVSPADASTIDDIIAAYEMQCAAIEDAGGRVILMASRALAAVADGPEEYARVYDRVLAQLRQPAILHWLGEMFDPALRGYWGKKDDDAAMEVAVDIITRNQANVDGIKISLLSAEKEIAMRRQLPDGVRMYTGDDFNYPQLIAGDEHGFSHALLGIFAAIAPAASAALRALDEDKLDLFHDILDPTLPLARHMFCAPTRFYKTGVVFLAYLNGHQDHFLMLGGQQSARSAIHLAELLRLADTAGVLLDPELACHRAALVLSTLGVEQA